MNMFRVWTRPLGNNTCRVQVDGMSNTQWLLDRLSRSFAFKSAESVHEAADSGYCTFQVMYTSQMTRSVLDRLLAGIPEVKLMVEPNTTKE